MKNKVVFLAVLVVSLGANAGSLTERAQKLPKKDNAAVIEAAVKQLTAAFVSQEELGAAIQNFVTQQAVDASVQKGTEGFAKQASVDELKAEIDDQGGAVDILLKREESGN